jgi:hypothetical protein
MAKMLVTVLTLLCAGVVVSDSTFSDSEANPIRKIVTMLQDMQHELEREAANEAELFEKAMCACDQGGKDLANTIAEASAAIEQLSAKVKQETAEKSSLAQELSDHYSGKESAESDLSQATMLREKEAKAFSVGEADKTTNIKALKGAISSIGGGASAASLMQTQESPKLRRMIEVSKNISPDSRVKVLQFLDTGLGDTVEGPTAPVAEIVGILKSMEDSMTSDYAALKSEETSAVTNFASLKAAKMQEIKAATDAIITKEKRAGAVAVSLSESTDSLGDATTEKENAQKFLADMNSQCAAKKDNRASRNKMRTEEIAAISDAITILNSDDSLETFKKAVPAFTQQKVEYDALLQIADGKKAPISRARNIVARMVKKHPSGKLNLLLLALDGKAKEEPAEGSTAAFAGEATKVVDSMIDGMVHVLHDEDVSDEHKKAWCANETYTADEIHNEKTTLTQQITSELEEMGDALATTEDEIKALQGAIAETDKNVHEASEQRKKEHQEFVDSFSTLDSAKRLVEKAEIRLRKFYAPKTHHKAVEETKASALAKAGLSLIKKNPAIQRMIASFDDSFIQKGTQHRTKVSPVVLPDTPTTYEKQENGGIVEIMNKMKEDIILDMTEAETEEKNAAKDYVRVMKDAGESRAQDTKSLNHKMSVKATLKMKITDAKELHELTEEEIHNLDLYMVQLHTECDFLARNFEIRHEGRVDEEVGLEEAKSIVTGEEPPNHKVVESSYEAEHTDADVEEHFEGGHTPGEGGALAPTEPPAEE